MMAKVYKKAGKDVNDVVRELIEAYHIDLMTYEVNVAVLFVSSGTDEDGEPKGNALTKHGHPCAALCRIADARMRTIGGVDAIIEVDAHRWDELSTESCDALLDHELTHLEVKQCDGLPLRHDDGRPILKTRKDDWCLTGFHEVIERHGKHALEAMSLRGVANACQGVFDFAKPGPKAAVA